MPEDNPVPVPDGTAARLELIGVLMIRRRRPVQASPIVCLTREDSAASPLPDLLDRLLAPAPARAPHVLVDASVDYTDPERPTRLPLLHELCAKLSNSSFGVGHLRFHHYLLAEWLTTQDLGNTDPRKQLVTRLRARADDGVVVPLFDAAAGIAPDPFTRSVFTLCSALWPVARFWLWVGGRLPGLGSQTRWFTRQHYLRPHDRNDFLGFAVRLAAHPDPDVIDKLLVHAFLEDLRRAYRRRPWRPRAWRRTTNTVVLVDNVTDANSGARLLRLINAVRAETGMRDPLVVVASCETTDSPGTGVGLNAVAEPVGAPRNRVPPSFRPPRGPVLARSGVLLSLVVILAVAASVAWVNPFGRNPTGECPRSVPGGGVSTEMINGECVGYSDSASRTFGQDARLLRDQRAIFAQNRCAEWLAGSDGRPFVTLVYFAGLTTPADGGDWSEAQSEELEGILLQQVNHNGQPRLNGTCAPSSMTTEPRLRVIVANGGAKMKEADRVVDNQLVRLFHEDKSALAVIGLDRSIVETEKAIAKLGNIGVPVIGTTLSGDGLENYSPLYFQMVPPNRVEAHLVAAYARYRNVRRIRVYHPSDSQDAYVSTLVTDLNTELSNVGIAFIDRPWTGDFVADQDGLTACGGGKSGDRQPGDLILYSGRHEDFGKFLNFMFGQCPDRTNTTPVVGVDSVSRFISFSEQSADAPIPANVTVDYVSKGSPVVLAGQGCFQGKYTGGQDFGGAIVQTFCADLTKLYGQLGQLSGMRWPGERVGLDYDTVGLLLKAASSGGYQDLKVPFIPNPSAVAAKIREIDYEGVTGRVSFRVSRIAEGKKLTVLRVDNIRNSTDTPKCVYLVEHDERHVPKDYAGDDCLWNRK
ncbi:hypothetical protein [Frankia sp. Cppng1_Ct_nod]|uniref:hypothetical protein n=1 Tax=Frankia sp. Cppng1_Ct_nod TaxID=2897162 RepID=UPI002023F257|nr:hypothetical protein [Frankia sp. Cppng1_Ct_nod]